MEKLKWIDPPAPDRNAPCPCGSGLKYKRCHLPLDEAGAPCAPEFWDEENKGEDNDRLQ